MRINKYLALQMGVSRRQADTLIKSKRVLINNIPANIGQLVGDSDTVTYDDKSVASNPKLMILAINKPTGFVCSREGQGSKTIYDLLPKQYHRLKPVGRLDKDSSGLLLLTNNGDLAHKLTHPSFQKQKVYEVNLNKALRREDEKEITTKGVMLDDGPSKLELQAINADRKSWRVTMQEGRNRQIRRTFEAGNYRVIGLRRISFGDFRLGNLKPGRWLESPPTQPS